MLGSQAFPPPPPLPSWVSGGRQLTFQTNKNSKILQISIFASIFQKRNKKQQNFIVLIYINDTLMRGGGGGERGTVHSSPKITIRICAAQGDLDLGSPSDLAILVD